MPAQAKEAYQKALDLEPDDTHLRASFDKADIQERKVVEARRHKFKGKSFGGLAGPGSKRERQGAAPPQGPKYTKQRVNAAKGSMLSFTDDDDDS